MVKCDVAGMYLGEARKLLSDAGINIHRITITSPPRDIIEDEEDYFRVITMKVIDINKVELLICKPL